MVWTDTAAKPLTRRQQAALDTRALILAAARKLYAKQGYVATTTSQIAKEAGVAHGTVYHHFGCKLGVYEAIASDLARNIFRPADNGRALGEGEPDIRPIVHQIFSAFREDAELVALVRARATGDFPQSDPGRVILTEALHRILDGWQRQGALQGADTALLASLVYAALEAAIRTCFEGAPASYAPSDPGRIDAHIESVSGFLEGALFAPTP